MAKKQKKKKKPVQLWKLFEKKGDSLKRENKSCPKCGAGYYMAKHKGRWTCGKCGYTLFESKEDSKESQ